MATPRSMSDDRLKNEIAVTMAEKARTNGGRDPYNKVALDNRLTTLKTEKALRDTHGGKAGLEAHLARKAMEKAAAEKARMDAAAAARKAEAEKEAADRAYWAAVRGPAPVAVDSAW